MGGRRAKGVVGGEACATEREGGKGERGQCRAFEESHNKTRGGVARAIRYNGQMGRGGARMEKKDTNKKGMRCREDGRRVKGLRGGCRHVGADTYKGVGHTKNRRVGVDVKKGRR